MGIFSKVVNKGFDKMMVHKIESFEGTCIAENEDTKIYVELSDLDGFKFLNFSIIGAVNVKLFEGCTITFHSNNTSLEVESDSVEIITDFSPSLKKGITEFDIELEDQLIDLIKNETLTSISIQLKKKSFEFPVTNQKEMKAIIS